MRKAAIFCKSGPDDADLNRIFNAHLRARIQSRTDLLSAVVTPENFESLAPQLRDVKVIFATWGMWGLSGTQFEVLRSLEAVFYAAGSVKHFARSLLERGIILTSAQGINAIPVAEFTLAQILLANKGYFRNVAEYRETPRYDIFRGRGNFGAQVSIVGAGQIGRLLIKHLRSFQLPVLVFDPLLSYKGAELLGVEKVESLEEAFSRGNIVTNHMADVPETAQLFRRQHFALLPVDATFINTGRGTTVDHEALLNILKMRPDVTALLDVTDPEPLPLDHPLRGLPNVHLSAHIAGRHTLPVGTHCRSAHIAGSIGDEVERMGEFALDEFERWHHGEPLLYPISLPMLETMA